MRAGVSSIHDLRSAIRISVGVGDSGRGVNYSRSQSAICIYFSRDKWVWVVVSVIHDLQSAICVYFSEGRG